MRWFLILENIATLKRECVFVQADTMVEAYPLAFAVATGAGYINSHEMVGLVMADVIERQGTLQGILNRALPYLSGRLKQEAERVL